MSLGSAYQAVDVVKRAAAKTLNRARDYAPLRQTSQDATPIAVYSALHTGPNSQSGGFQFGFFSVCTEESTYHPWHR